MIRCCNAAIGIGVRSLFLFRIVRINAGCKGGVLEGSIGIANGDRMKIGSAMFAVTQPRMPCFKLGIRFGDPTIVKRFYKSGKWGFYLSVLEEGEIETGDEIVVTDRLSDISLAEVSRCFLDPFVDSSLLAKVRKSELALQMKEQLEYQLGRH